MVKALVLPALAALCILLAACGDREGQSTNEAPAASATAAAPRGEAFVGSRSCRACHERFYELWAPSHHGTAMRPYTPALGAEAFTPQVTPIDIDGVKFQAALDDGHVVETAPGREPFLHSIAYVMGGKNVFYLLTPREKGRLQVLPVAYEVHEKRWYDTTASMVRHATGHRDRPVHWTDPLLTFNTSCWNCHVSQLSVNYDVETDTYHSTWREPGINCETCHGPGDEHVAVCEAAPEGSPPADLKIVRISRFTHEQRNDTCAPCHAKAVVLTDDFTPGARYFDHFDLVTLEDADYYPDGRDLGENYTFTTWRMSPCAKSGELDCVHCHTSSGRTRHVGEESNRLCLPCHQDHVEDAAAHSHHEEGSEGSRCVSCHMPMTAFAHMRRSDHSMRPPAPRLTERFGSPNACNLCHEDKDATWAYEHVRAWRERDYQAPMLRAGELVDEARHGDWKDLEDMIAYLARDDRDEITATSLLRLLRDCQDPRKVPALVDALKDPSPLVRSAAAEGLQGILLPEVVRALFAATADDVRLVRVRAAGALAGLPTGGLPRDQAAQLGRAMLEYEASLTARPDTWSSYYNLGNLHERRGELDEALKCYERASRMRPDVVQPYVNASMIHARRGHPGLAENLLRKALAVGENVPAVHYNLGLLLAEGPRRDEAQKHLDRALALDPHLAGAAYNLGLMVVGDDPAQGLAYLRRANAEAPHEPRYAWALAYHLSQGDRRLEALAVLLNAVKQGAVSADVYRLLAVVYWEHGRKDDARSVLHRAIRDPRIPTADQAKLLELLRQYGG